MSSDISKFRQILSGIESLAVVLGVPFFLWQQWQSSEVRASQTTLSYISAFQSESMQKIKSDLLEPWLSYSSEILSIDKTGGFSSKDLSSFVNGLVDASVEKDSSVNLRNSIISMADFYDQIWFCLASTSCDRVLTLEYFQPEANQFLAVYGPWITQAQVRLSLPRLGAGAEAIVAAKITYRRGR